MIEKLFSPTCASLRLASVRSVVLLLALVGVLSSPFFAQTKAPYGKQRLLGAVRDNAQTKELSPAQLINYIEERGVDFELTPQDETNFRNAGATSEVIAAIRQHYRLVLPKGSGSLTINSQAGSKVIVNGKLRGETPNGGLLRLPPLKAGAYKVSVKKENHEDQERSIVIAPGISVVENFILSPRKGSLTVVPTPSGARVTVRGMDYPEGVQNLALEPGSYEVRVSKEGYKTAQRLATVEPGQPSSISVILEVLRVEEMLKESIDSFKQKNYLRAIAISRDVLSAKPEEPKANLVLGLSYFNSGNYEAAVGNLVKAISLGEQVMIPLQYHTTYGLFPRSDNLTPGTLIIGKNLLEFRTLAESQLFSVPLEKVYRVIPEDNRGGRLQMKIGNPKKKKDDGKDFNFHPMQAGLRQVVVGNSVTMAIYCQNCLPVAQAIYQIVQQVQLSSRAAIPAKL